MSTQAQWQGKAYGSQAEFYCDAYGQYVVEMQAVGRTGATVIVADQSAGDWSDAATPDLTIAMLTSAPVRAEIDLGAGLFEKRQNRNDCIVIAPGVATKVLIAGAHRAQALSIPYERLLRLAGDDSGLPSDGDFGQVHAGLCHDRELSTLLNALRAESLGYQRRGALWADGAVLQVASALLRLQGAAEKQAPSSGSAGGLAPWQARRVTDYLQTHLADDVTLPELATIAGLSVSHFCRAFKQSTGLPPHQWRLARRIERAKELLERTELPVAQVAAAVGYDDPGQFASSFRRATGASPSQYRREEHR